jgi:sarcosine oxidase subunit beta
VARIVVAGGGAIGASIAYHLALGGASDVVLAERGTIASGSTGRAMGGIRQQFSSAAEVRLAQESIDFFEDLGPDLFQQVGYLFLATTEEALRSLEERQGLQAGLGVPVERLDQREVEALAPGVFVGDVLGGFVCRQDGVADPPAVTHELVRRLVELGVDVLEGTSEEDVGAEVRVLACGAYSAEAATRYDVELPVRPLVRQLFDTSPIRGLSQQLPMVLEAESGFHFRRYGDSLRVAMHDPKPRWSFEPAVEETILPERLEDHRQLLRKASDR